MAKTKITVILATLDSNKLDKAINIQHQKLAQFLLLMSNHPTFNPSFHTERNHVSVDLKQYAYSSKVW